jgi:hypothetical protein
VVLGQPTEKSSQLGPVALVKRSQEVRAVSLGYSTHLPQCALSSGGDIQSRIATVTGISAALEQAASLQVVNEHHQSAGQQTQLCGHRLLGPPGFRGDDPKQPGLWWGQARFAQPLPEPHGRETTDLSSQEGQLAGPFGRPLPATVLHLPIVT